MTRRICDLELSEIVVGLKVRSLRDNSKVGEIVRIDHRDDSYAWILWPGDDEPRSGFYWNHCQCEIVE